MSVDVRGGIDYALMKRHYDSDDYVVIPATAIQEFYIVGLMAYLSDQNVVDPFKGWTIFTHAMQTAPAFLAPVLAALNVVWPAQVPAFEAKDILFEAVGADINIRFEGNSRVQHLIPAGTTRRFHRRCFMFFVQRAALVNGILRVWIEG